MPRIVPNAARTVYPDRGRIVAGSGRIGPDRAGRAALLEKP
jgi:hypothetical protein